jgi:hypothetical protein
MRVAVLLCVLASACGADDGDPTDAGVDASAVPDDLLGTPADLTAAVVDAASADAAFDLAGPSCADPVPCATPAAASYTLCGRLADVETGQPVGSDLLVTCDPANPTASGPCSLALRFYDALDFSQNPSAATPLVPGALLLDGCGRFRAENLPSPTFGFFAVVVDDAPTVADAHSGSMIIVDKASAQPARSLAPLVVRNAVNTAWSTGTGLAPPTLAERGVALLIFRAASVPRSGVAVQRSGSAIQSDDFYFSDLTATRSTIAAAQDLTGANGSALVINTPSLTNHSGAGGEPAGCTWPTSLVASVPGFVSVFSFSCP